MCISGSDHVSLLQTTDAGEEIPGDCKKSLAVVFTFDIESQKILTLNQLSANLLGYSIEELKNLLFAPLRFGKVIETKFTKKSRRTSRSPTWTLPSSKKTR